jgi:hypothetical protein
MTPRVLVGLLSLPMFPCGESSVRGLSTEWRDLGRQGARNPSAYPARKCSSEGHYGHWRMNMEMLETETHAAKRPVWNAGRTVGAKRALKPKQIWEIRFYLNQRRRLRDRALFDPLHGGVD